MPQPPRRRRSSISDVARLAGVSVGTVSNVLNRPQRVSAATRERVQAAIAELQFVPNGSARQLRVGSVTTAGAIVLDLTNPFFTDVARGMEDRLAQDDWTLMVASSEEAPEREARFRRLFEQHGVQGVALVPSSEDVAPLLALHERGVRVVLLDRPSPVPQLASVAVDDVAGAAMAARHLLAQGHRRLVLLNGPRTILQCADRSAGVVAALTEAGLDPAEALEEVTVTLNAAGGERGAREVLARRTGRGPVAVFCVNDLVALGVLRTLRREGVDVPGEVAVVGYDDVSYAAELTVPLTSVRQPTHDLGWTAADLLVRGGAAESVVFQPELVVRESSGGGAAG